MSASGGFEVARKRGNLRGNLRSSVHLMRPQIGGQERVGECQQRCEQHIRHTTCACRRERSELHGPAEAVEHPCAHARSSLKARSTDKDRMNAPKFKRLLAHKSDATALAGACCPRETTRGRQKARISCPRPELAHGHHTHRERRRSYLTSAALWQAVSALRRATLAARSVRSSAASAASSAQRL